jgi:dTDP-6-deoxy-L-talose 4-dehydrogenase (NAD+)
MTWVLLTGATGFVGRQVLRSLKQAGAQVTAVVRAGGPRPESADRIIETTDLFAEDTAFWASACAGMNAVGHVAWYAEPGKYLHSALNLRCLTGTLALAQGAVDAGVLRFVGVGTCFEYDLAGGVLGIDTPLRPITPYAAAKAAAYLALSQALPQAGLSFAWCRLFYLHGEGEDARRLAPHLLARLAAGEPAELTSGRQIRDFLDVAEAGRRIATAILGTSSGALNICSGTPITVRQFAEGIAARFGRPDLLRFGVRPDNAVDPPCVLGIPSSVN